MKNLSVGATLCTAAALALGALPCHAQRIMRLPGALSSGYYGFYNGPIVLPDADAGLFGYPIVVGPNGPASYPVSGFAPYGVVGDTPIAPPGSYEPPPFDFSDSIEARRLSGNRVFIQWQGDPRPISRMTFALLDRRRKLLASQPVTTLPAEATMPLKAGAAYYRISILYTEGAARSLVFPVPALVPVR